MANRLQHVLLNGLAGLVCVLNGNSVLAQDDPNDTKVTFVDQVMASDLDTEYFDIGVFTGIINIEDFNSELLYGVSATFRASEDFFLQFNYLQADSNLSSYELSQGQLFSGDDRIFKHYDFLIGYNIFQGEFFSSGTRANLSALYVVGGVGDTEFGGEGNFTYTLGIGYQVALKRRYIIRADMRDYFYESNLLLEGKNTHNIQFSIGLSYLL